MLAGPSVGPVSADPPRAADTAHLASSAHRVADVFPGNSEMAARCRVFDWAATPLGPVERWSASLRTTVGIVLTSRQPMFIWWGPELVQIYNDAYRPSLGVGGRAERALGARGREFWTDIWEAIGPQIDQVMRGGESTWHEDQYLPIERNGRLEDVWWTYSYSPVRDDDGSIAATLVVCQETTERVRSKGDLSAAHDRITRLHRVGVALAGATTEQALATAVMHEGLPAVGATSGAVTRLSADGSEFEVLASHNLPNDAAARWARLPNRPPSPHAEVLAERRPLFFESLDGYTTRYPELGEFWRAAGVGAGAVLPLVVGGAPFGVLSIHFPASRPFTPEDREFLVTVAGQCAEALERARLFEAERRAREEAERANRAKADFLAVMSHELRTPLNAIGGYAELLELGIRGPVTPDQRKDLQRVQVSQRHLLGLINEVLNYAKLETGAVRYDLVEVGLPDALADAEALVAPQARARSLEMIVVPCAPTLAVRADAEKLRQILVNLLSNAVKFTDGGGRVELACADDGERVRVVVRDTGIGIAADQLGRIFEPFVQVRAQLTRTADGTGLGLAISRDLARGMGGELTAESTLGAGSAFTLTLPRA